MPDHTAAIKMVLDALTDADTGVIQSLSEIDAVGHRLVHGGEKFASSTLINEEVIAAITECNDLAPLHNPANLIGIRACQELMPVFLILHSIRPCRKKHICMVFLMNTMKNTKSEDMDSMEPAILMYPKEQRRCWAKIIVK